MSRTLRVAVVDDEELARARLVRLLARDADVRVVGVCSNGLDAIATVRSEKPDVLLLDVQMPELDGFGVVSALAGEGRMPLVVFVTAFDAHAVRAFEVQAADYLLKPVAADRLESAVARARTRLTTADAAARGAAMIALVRDAAELPAAAAARTSGSGVALEAPADDSAVESSSTSRTAPPLERFLVKTGERTLLVKASDVDWIEAEANYVRLHVGTKSHLVRGTMASLEQRLDGVRFARIHRSTIVNLDRIREIQPWFSGDQVVLLHDGTQLRLSRGYAAHLEERLRA